MIYFSAVTFLHNFILDLLCNKSYVNWLIYAMFLYMRYTYWFILSMTHDHASNYGAVSWLCIKLWCCIHGVRMHQGFYWIRILYILVANLCNARASCEIGLLVKNNLPNLLKIYLQKINLNLIKIYLVLVLLD